MHEKPEQQALCDASGFKYPISQLVRQWDGAMVHRSFLDKRNPQDFVTGVRDNSAPRLSRPEAPDVFIATPVTPDDL